MTYTSAEANKLLNSLYSEQSMLLRKESDSCVFIAATCEDIEEARPDYDYGETQARLAELEEKIRKVKHAINVFNVTHEIPGFGMTIDQALVCLPQLTRNREKLSDLCTMPVKDRLSNRGGSSLIEYRYTNYDVAAAAADLRAVSERLAKLQNALDLENSTVRFEIQL